MKSEVLWQIIQAIVLGAGLLAYAHANFATKSESEKIHETVIRIDERVFQLVKKQGIE
jgi:tetrahydromethanopterin S-methyltransferase subunit E